MGRDLGHFLQQCRHRLGLSRRDLAERSGVSYPYVSQIETGEREPSLRTMHALARALDVPVEQLAGLTSPDEWLAKPEVSPAPPASASARPPGSAPPPGSASAPTSALAPASAPAFRAAPAAARQAVRQSAGRLPLAAEPTASPAPVAPIGSPAAEASTSPAAAGAAGASPRPARSLAAPASPGPADGMNASQDAEVEPSPNRMAMLESSTPHDSVEMWRDKVMPAVERRLNSVPPVERVVLLNELLAQAVGELVAEQSERRHRSRP